MALKDQINKISAVGLVVSAVIIASGIVLEDKEFHDTIGDLLTKLLQYNASKSKDAGQLRENDNFESGNEQ